MEYALGISFGNIAFPLEILSKKHKIASPEKSTSSGEDVDFRWVTERIQSPI